MNDFDRTHEDGDETWPTRPYEADDLFEGATYAEDYTEQELQPYAAAILYAMTLDRRLPIADEDASGIAKEIFSRIGSGAINETALDVADALANLVLDEAHWQQPASITAAFDCLDPVEEDIVQAVLGGQVDGVITDHDDAAAILCDAVESACQQWRAAVTAQWAAAQKPEAH